VVPTHEAGVTCARRSSITEAEPTLLLPVLPLKDLSLFPGGSLSVVTSQHGTRLALEIAARSGKRLLAVTQKDGGFREMHAVGTVALLAEDLELKDGSRRVEVDGTQRARVVNLVGADTVLAEAELLSEGDPGDEWGPAVEALARYLHSHATLRTFLEGQRRSGDPMSWVNLACQHLPIAATARQRLLESSADERCQRISRGLDALLRKETQP
jgi:ATP-dependent Lon protease